MSEIADNSTFLIDEQSFTWLFNTYWQKVYKICYKNILSHEDAKELTQNVFKSLWERRSEIKITVDVEHYIMRSAKLQTINFFRDNKIKLESLHAFYQKKPDAEHSTENDLLYNELSDELKKLIDQLPAQCRLVYRLSNEKHLSNKEIASKLDISIKTVEYHLSNAKKIFRTNLQHLI